jgi:hypothetical protein
MGTDMVPRLLSARPNLKNTVIDRSGAVQRKLTESSSARCSLIANVTDSPPGSFVIRPTYSVPHKAEGTQQLESERKFQ